MAASYAVTGGYTSPNFNGSVTGTLDGTPANGQFTGVMSAEIPNCTARTNYAGTITSTSLSLNFQGQIDSCVGNSPLAGGVAGPASSAPASTTSSSTTISTSTTTSTIGAQPDLLPFSQDPSFCRRTSTSLLVNVRNQGNANATAFVTRVIFNTRSGKVPVDASAGSLGAGASVDLSFNDPGGCFIPDCVFSIAVDVNGAVTESSETNNSAQGICRG
jgi:hypothetical protein